MSDKQGFWASRDPWTNNQKLLITSLALFIIIDYGQTSWGQSQNPPWIECNSILGEHPTQSEIDRYFASSLILSFLVSHVLKSK